MPAARNKGITRPRKSNGGRDTTDLTVIPGIGASIAKDLRAIGIRNVSDLAGKDPERLYRRSNDLAGVVQDRCLLYAFRCAVYYAGTEGRKRDPELLKWWNWKDTGKRR
jgi:hypothetical protein